VERVKRDNLVAIILSILLSYFTYRIIQSELPQTLADYNGHTYVYLPLFTGGDWVQGWKTVPYCIWHMGVLGMYHVLHIPLEVSAAYMSIFFSLLSFYIMYWMVLRYTAHAGREVNSAKAAFVAFGLSVIQPLYFFWLDAGNRFLGSYSMNPIHNPTQMSMRPFALLCFCLVYDIWNKQREESYKGVFFNMQKGLKRHYIYLAIALLLSTMTKPTFAEMFIPAVALLMLVEWIGRIRRKDGSARGYFTHCLHMFFCAIPGLLYILLEFFGYFIWGGSYGADGSFMITKWLEVWSMFTENVALSILLGMAFPLFLLLIDVKFFLKDNLGRLALVGYGIGFFEAALLGEGGVKLSHGDFMWPMMSGMMLMFTAAILHLLALEQNCGEMVAGEVCKCQSGVMQEEETGLQVAEKSNYGRIRNILVDAGWAIFCAHIFCGLLYIQSLITVVG